MPETELINPQDVADWLLTSGLKILVIAILALVAFRLLSLLTKRLSGLVQRLDDIEDSEQDRRVRTIFRVVKTTGLALIGVTAILMILDELSIDITPVLASVGVAGLAVGLGAQSLVNDAISGLFILVEGQYQVGDVVEVAGCAGTVEELTLRTTHIRDLNGYLHIVPNGEIRLVTNRNRDWSRALVDVGITYEDDLDLALEVLADVGRAVQADETIGPLLLEEPLVTGVEGLDDWQIRLRIWVKTLPGEHWEVQRHLRRQINAAFANRGISLATPRQEILLLRDDQHRDESGSA